MAPPPGIAMAPTSWLKSPGVKVLRIEVFVVAAAVLLFLQLIFGFHRRRSGGIVIQGGLWVACTLSFPLITNTIGQMASAQDQKAVYAVWVVTLYHILGSTNSAVAYDLDDSKKWKRRIFEQIQYLLYSYSMFLILYTISDIPHFFLVDTLLAIVLWSNMTSVLSCWMANVSNPSKIVADYMKDLLKCDQRRFSSLKEYHDCYPVHCRDNFHPVISSDPSGYISKVRENDGIIMMGDIQEYGGVVLPGLHGSTRLTDICFSFSLFQLLKRRYFGMPCVEAGTPEALDLVLTGFLSDDKGDQGFAQENLDQVSERTFRVVEVQLGFLYDFFFTRYAFYFEMGNLSRNCAILKILLIILVGFFVYRNSIRVVTTATTVEGKTQQQVDIIITLIVFGVLLSVEIVQLAMYLASDWACVARARFHVVKKSNAKVRNGCNCLAFLRRIMCFSGYWRNEIGQYSILESGPRYSYAMTYLYRQKLVEFDYANWRQMKKSRFDKWVFLCIASFFRKEKNYKELSPTVKKAIIFTLQSCKGQLTNGEASLMDVDQSGNLVEQFKWAMGYESQAEIMLVWHIATTYCEIAQSSQVNNNVQTHEHGQQDHEEIASVLSRYCTYLMAFVPELLPDPEADTKFIFATAVNQAEQIWKLESDKEKFDFMETILQPEGATDLEDQQEEEQNTYESMIKRGIRLGRQLQSIDDMVLRWKVMANFWAEKFLYIAPSDNVSGHIEHLANGGEFLTHVWALLSNAGILNIDRKYDQSRTATRPAFQNA